jgi:hypothetical protein
MGRFYSLNWKLLLKSASEANIDAGQIRDIEKQHEFEKDQTITQMKLQLTQKDIAIKNLEDLIQLQQQTLLEIYHKSSELEVPELEGGKASVEGKEIKGVDFHMLQQAMEREKVDQEEFEQGGSKELGHGDSILEAKDKMYRRLGERNKLIAALTGKIEEQQKKMEALKEEITSIKQQKDNGEGVRIKEMKSIIQGLQAQLKDKFDDNYSLIRTIKAQREAIAKLRLSNIQLQKKNKMYETLLDMARKNWGQLVVSNCNTAAVEEGHFIYTK